MIPGGSSNPNDTTVAPTPSPWDDPFTLFNTNSSYGLNAIVSSAATKLVQETRSGYDYVGMLTAIDVSIGYCLLYILIYVITNVLE